VPAGGAECAPQADLAAPLQHADHHHVGDADPIGLPPEAAEAVVACTEELGVCVLLKVSRATAG
jgi:hypothetical protein